MLLSNEKLLDDARGLGQLTQKSLPVRVSYAIAKNVSKIESNLKIYNKEKQKLIEKYSVKDKDGKTVIKDGGQITIQQEFVDEWNKDMNELKNIENEIDIHKFNINDILNGNYDMTPLEIMLIDYMIEEDK